MHAPSERDAVVRLLEHGLADGLLDRFVESAAAALGVAAATITLPDDEHIKSYGTFGVTPYLWPRSQSLSHLVIATAETVVVEDLRAWPNVDAASRLLAADVRFYAGAPLIAPGNRAIGALNILGFEPRRFSPVERASLAAFANLAMLLLRERLDRLTIEGERDDYRGIIDDAPTAILSTDRAGNVLSWNAAAERLFGWDFETASTQPLIGVAPERRPAVAAALRRVVDEGIVVQAVPSVGVASDGRRLDLLMSAAPKRDSFGIAIGASIVVEDASAEIRRAESSKRRSAVLELAAADATLDRVLTCLAAYVDHAIPSSQSAVLVRDDLGRVVPFASATVANAMRTHIDTIARLRVPFPLDYSMAGSVPLAGYAAEGPREALYRELRDVGYRTTWRQPIFDSRNTLRGAIVAHVPHDRPPTGDEIRTLQEATALAAIAIEGDLSRAMLERLALHDALTGLPNRTLMERRLEVERRGVQRGGLGFALAMLDVDRFKIVKDSLGHAVGDQLIVEIGNRLRATTRDSDFVARLAGDEFLIILGNVTDRATATRVMSDVLDSLEQQLAPGGHELFVRASVGIALHPADASEPAELMRRADLAIYAVKGSGSRIGFVEDAAVACESTLELETELNRAVAQNEFELHYQPNVDEPAGRMTSAEALLRWRHPRLGMLAPGAFIAIAEQTGLIVPIGEWVLREACRFARRWRDAGGPGVVSVNVSARQFENRDFVETVFSAIDRAGIAPSQLWLEVTETLIMRSPETTTATPAALRSRGVRSTIDDFGTGYSSRNYLKRYPIAGLKIDRAFVKDLDGSAAGGGDRAIIATIVALGAALGLTIVAEDAETREQVDILRELGCEQMQGFYFARPMPADALVAWTPSRPSAVASSS